MTTVLTLIPFLAIIVLVTNGVTDQDRGRTFILNPNHLSWEEASRFCQDMNGHLGTIDHLYVVPDLGYSEQWTLWVGLKLTSPDNLTWSDGAEVEWTNWHGQVDSNGGEALCVSVITEWPFSWVKTSCDQSLPSLCEVAGGTCRFTSVRHASLTAWNDLLANINKSDCLALCEITRVIDCRSVEVNRGMDMCQLSTQSRWTKPQDFFQGDRYWDYYHFTCVNGTYLDNTVQVSPNGVDLPTSTPPHPTISSSTLPPTTSSALPTTADSSKDEEVVCFKKKIPLPNETQAVEQDVKELQTLSLAYKEQSRMKKKISTPDPRPSATYVGSLAVGLVVVVLGVIVCLDILSLQRFLVELHSHGAPCGKCAKLLMKKKLKKTTRVKFSRYPASFTSTHHNGIPTFVDGRVPHFFRPLGMATDQHMESIYHQQQEDTSTVTADTHPETQGESEHLTDSPVPRSAEAVGGDSVLSETAGPSQSGFYDLVDPDSVSVENLQQDRSREVDEHLVTIERDPGCSCPSHTLQEDSANAVNAFGVDSVQDERGHSEGDMAASIRLIIIPHNTQDTSGNHEHSLHSDSPHCVRELAADLQIFQPDSESENTPQIQTQEAHNTESVLGEEMSTNSPEQQCEGVNMSDVVVDVTNTSQVSEQPTDDLIADTTATTQF